jgi:hypothetical protein
MEIIIKMRDTDARRTEYYLRRRYKSKSGLAKLAKVAILREASNEAKLELEELDKV